MLTILRIALEVLLETFLSIKYRKLVEMIWSLWYQVTFSDVEFISQISLTVSPSKMSTGLTVKFVWSGKTKQRSALLPFQLTSIWCLSSHGNARWFTTNMHSASVAGRYLWYKLCNFPATYSTIFLSQRSQKVLCREPEILLPPLLSK